jgi:glycosyltransferase involved in cell wall biosynthesis
MVSLPVNMSDTLPPSPKLKATGLASVPQLVARPHVLVHDYAGHPFTAELSRQLARNGWRISHVFFAGDAGPKGRNTREADDPASLTFHDLTIDQSYSKTNFFKRRQGDIAYGKRLAQLVRDLSPDIVLSGNTPTETQQHLMRASRTTGATFIYWCQDFYSIAASRILRRKLPGIGHLVGWYYTALERQQMLHADHVIHITDGFLPTTDNWSLPRDRVSVIPNWGVIDEIPLMGRDTDWASRQGLRRLCRVVYSGTLAAKHNPEHLAAVARTLGDETDVVVVGFGAGADKLAAQSQDLPNLTVLPLQPFAMLPQVLASADVLIAVIERDAGAFSVPSKVLSYLCAGRPIVLSAPADNLAARMVREAGAGRVVEPEDQEGFVAAVRDLMADPAARQNAGEAGRRYAEQNFTLDVVASRFEAVFARLPGASVTTSV